MSAQPFLKWAGGKRQLLNELTARLPQRILSTKDIKTYIEPFVGGGSFFFHLTHNFSIKQSILIDINQDLILSYKTVKQNPSGLIDCLSNLQSQYLTLDDSQRQDFYYNIRKQFNSSKPRFDYGHSSSKWIERASQIIFLNRTCFNGLFRENSKGEFNVPFGRYSNPKICDPENIANVSSALKNAEILCGDFTLSKQYISNDTLLYLDPPYRPISKSSSFTKYSQDGFTDKDQVRLKQFIDNSVKIGAHFILSNSDPKNKNPDDNFFDDLYKDYKIERVKAKRNINSVSTARKPINELIIS